MIMLDSITGREDHPLLRCLTETEEAQLPAAMVKEFYDMRREALILEASDPLRYGYEPEIWKLADEQTRLLREKNPKGVITELDLGGNRAGKTERRAKRLVQNMVKNPGWRAWALQSTQVSSRQNQQSIIYKYLPPEWKPQSGKLRHGSTTKIVYSQAGGFTEDTLVCPNGSQCWFKFYSMDVKGVEGAELNEAWPDELVTPDWIDALIYRLVTRNGLLGITFTPVAGWTQTVKMYLSGAVTQQEVPAELLPIKDAHQAVVGYEKVPRVQENLIQKATIVYFHTQDNPFGNYESMKATLEGKSSDIIKMRAYGVPTRAMASNFPLFTDSVHIVKRERIAQILAGAGTHYHLVDPCSGRNWFMGWVFVDELNRKFIWREWPSHGHPAAYIPGVGELEAWTIPGNAADGERGGGQTELGWGLLRYKEEIYRNEAIDVNGEACSPIMVFERWMDARYGNARTVAQEESKTLIDECEEIGLDFLAAPSERQIFSNRAEGSLRMINDMLYYDVERANKENGITALNQPHLYISEDCPNTIYALKEWTGLDGQHGACKDPIDMVRMLALAKLEHVEETALKPRTPWANSHKR